MENFLNIISNSFKKSTSNKTFGILILGGIGIGKSHLCINILKMCGLEKEILQNSYKLQNAYKIVDPEFKRFQVNLSDSVKLEVIDTFSCFSYSFSDEKNKYYSQLISLFNQIDAVIHLIGARVGSEELTLNDFIRKNFNKKIYVIVAKADQLEKNYYKEMTSHICNTFKAEKLYFTGFRPSLSKDIFENEMFGVTELLQDIFAYFPQAEKYQAAFSFIRSQGQKSKKNKEEKPLPISKKRESTDLPNSKLKSKTPIPREGILHGVDNLDEFSNSKQESKFYKTSSNPEEDSNKLIEEELTSNIDNHQATHSTFQIPSKSPKDYFKQSTLSEKNVDQDYGKKLCEHITLESIPETLDVSVVYLKKSTVIDTSLTNTNPENIIENAISYETEENNSIEKIDASLREEISNIRLQLQSVKQDQLQYKTEISKKLVELEKAQQLFLQYREVKEVIKKEREKLLYQKGECIKIYYQTFTTRLCAALHAIRLLQSGFIKREEGSINNIKGLQSPVSSAAKVANIGMSASNAFLNNLDTIASATGKVSEVISSAGLKLLSSKITDITTSIPVLGTITSIGKVASEFAINTLDKRALAEAEDCLNQFTAHALEKLADELARQLSFLYEEQINLLTPKSAARFAECGVNRVLAGLFNEQIKSITFVQDAIRVIRTYEINQAQIKIETIQIVFGIPFREQRLEAKIKTNADITEDKLYRKTGLWMQENKEIWYFSNDFKKTPDGISTYAKEVGYIKTDKIPTTMARDVKRLGPSCLLQENTVSNQYNKLHETQKSKNFTNISPINGPDNRVGTHLSKQGQRNRNEGDEKSQISTLWLKIDILTTEIANLKNKSNMNPSNTETADFKKILSDLIVKEKFKFSLTYSNENQLIIQFTAINSVIMTNSEIKDQLVKLIRLFNSKLIGMGFENQYELAVEWETMKFILSAKSNECIQQILTFLKATGESYWSKNYFRGNVFEFFGATTNKGKISPGKSLTEEQYVSINAEQHSVSCALQ